MTKSSELSTIETKCCLLDLHEDILRDIFHYVDYSKVYLTLRRVCHKLKDYVDAYVQLGGIFMLTRPITPSPTSIFHVFKQSGKVVSISSSEVGTCFPRPTPEYDKWSYDSQRLYFDMGSFGAVCNGKIVAGLFYRKELPWSDHVLKHGWRYTENIGACYLAEYSVKENKWLEILQTNEVYSPTNFFAYKCDVVSHCTIGDSILVWAYDDKDCLNLRRFYFYISDHHKQIAVDGTAMIINIDNSTSTYFTDFTDSDFTTFDRWDIIGHLYHDSRIIQVEDNQLILVGGRDGRHDYKLNRKLLQGTVTKEEKDVTWKQLDLELIKPRIRAICFKLKDNLYIAGGQTLVDDLRFGPMSVKDTDYSNLLCCDIYNFKEGKYHQSVHFLPYPVDARAKIVTDADETFAIITGNNTSTFLVFTEKGGFDEFPNVTSEELCLQGIHIDKPDSSRILFRIK